VVVNAMLYASLLDWQAVKPQRVALILSLFFESGPATVRWLVVAVCFYAVKRFSFRALSHISFKYAEAVPLSAYLDASPPVNMKVGV